MKDIDLLSSLSSLYREKFGEGPENVVRLAGAGSDRIYYRLAGNGHSAIGVSADSLKDAEAFLALTPVLRRSGVNAPEIYGVAPNDPRIYLQEDLGESQLLPVLVKRDEKGELTEEAWHLAKESLAQLARFQTIRYDEWKDAEE